MHMRIPLIYLLIAIISTFVSYSVQRTPPIACIKRKCYYVTIT
ncbi:hypothetical protein Pint_27175 [Pistacia integerrima]|uniref:Uncharacterized protein n=1 Tax=Pistacia integerrima TaxID=434235 RepID=A0ACC0YQK8_9ROSI|nr:hypothetical protein Pint_27175 [Pistacia integerrima]